MTSANDFAKRLALACPSVLLLFTLTSCAHQPSNSDTDEFEVAYIPLIYELYAPVAEEELERKSFTKTRLTSLALTKLRDAVASSASERLRSPSSKLRIMVHSLKDGARLYIETDCGVVYLSKRFAISESVMKDAVGAIVDAVGKGASNLPLKIDRAEEIQSCEH